MLIVKQATTREQVNAIIRLRYMILRKPWDQPADTATDALEETSFNACIEVQKGEVIACGRLQENDADTGQVRFMAVNTGYQGKGLGKNVLDFLELEAKNRGLKKIELQARENALAFYKHCGYTVKEKSFLLWGQIQHYHMEKNIK